MPFLKPNPLAFAENVKKRGKDKKGKEKESAVVIVLNNKICYETGSYKGGKKPEALENKKDPVLCFIFHLR